MAQRAESVEVLVIGGGVIGSSIAYHVARQGRRVLVVERSEVAAEPAASWASAGGVRRQGQARAEAALASEAIARWHTLAEELETDLQYRRGGNLLLAENDEEAAQLQAFVRQQHELGFGDVAFVDRRQVFSLVPALCEQVVGGGWPGDPTPDGRSYTLRPESRTGNWATACELFPPLRQQQIARAWGGLQAYTFDDLPFIGSFSGLEGLTLALGSWFGFAVAPAIGRCVADHLAGLPTPELGQLTPDRIAHFDSADVAAFLA